MVSPFQRILPSIFPSTIHLNFSSSFLCPISPRLPRIPSSFFFPVCLSAIRGVDERLLPSSSTLVSFSFHLLLFFSLALLVPRSFRRSFLDPPRLSFPLSPRVGSIYSFPRSLPTRRRRYFLVAPFLPRSPPPFSLFLLSSPLLFYPICTTLLSYPLFRSLSLHRSGTPFSRFARWQASTLSLSPLFLSLYYTRRFLFLLVGARFTFFQRYRRSSSALLGLFPFVVPSYPSYRPRLYRRTVILETTNQLFLRENVSGNGFSPPG